MNSTDETILCFSNIPWYSSELISLGIFLSGFIVIGLMNLQLSYVNTKRKIILKMRSNMLTKSLSVKSGMDYEKIIDKNDFPYGKPLLFNIFWKSMTSTKSVIWKTLVKKGIISL